MGICTTVLRKSLAPWLLALLAACEASTPATFDAEGAADDAAAVDAVFATPVMQSLAFAGAEIDRATSGAEADADAVTRTASFSSRMLDALREPGSRIRPSAGELPQAVAGRTYIFDAALGSYVVSDVPGAPSAGVRFQLYALDPAAAAPVEPLVQLGYVDIIDEGGSTFRIRVADEAGTRLEYRVVASGTEAESRVRVEGFTADGSARADFGFENRIELTGASSGMMRLSEILELPGRSVELECASILLVRAGLPPELQLDLILRGPNGEVAVAGAYELGGGGALDVDVNGASYAEVLVAGSDYHIAGDGGQPLPESSVELLGRVIGARDAGLELFDLLVRPVETLIAP